MTSYYLFPLFFSCLLCTALEAQIQSYISARPEMGAGFDHPWSETMDRQLLRLHQRHLEALQTGTAVNWERQFPNLTIADKHIAVELLFRGAVPREARAYLDKIGCRDIIVYEHVLNAWMPVATLGQLRAVPQMVYARAVRKPRVRSGIVTSQGDIAQQSDAARSAFGLSGAGVKVGVLSDSYDALGGAAAGISNGELPGPGNPQNDRPVEVLLDNFNPGNIDEGRAMMEIIHDVAPAAELAFHTAFGGIATFASGIRALEAAGCEVIVDDVFYLNDAFFQDGLVAQAADEVVERGAVYLSAAGNQARDSYEAAFNPIGTVTVGTVPYAVHGFLGTDFLQQITVAPLSTVSIVLQWDDPFLSVTGSEGAASDLDIILVDGTETTAIAGGTNNNLGNDAVEILQFTNTSAVPQLFNLLIGLRQGATPNLVKYIIFNGATINEYATNSSTCVGQPNAAGALAVGAAFWAETPPFGQTPPLLEPFSSAGGTPILFDTQGNPIAPDIRQKPDFTAPDGGNTSFFGSDINDSDTFPNFFGTSAAAPHAAGVAALLLEQQPTATPATIRDILTQTAIEMGPPGFDFDTGAGLIDALAAVSSGAGPEVCDGVDNDGDGLIDDADPDVADQQLWFEDFDGDGFGNTAVSLLSCTQPVGFVSNAEDCNDTLAVVNPSATEICDGLDNNCDGVLEADVLTISYAQDTFTTNDQAPGPAQVSLPDGQFSAAPGGLIVDPSTGVIDIANSQVGTYEITYAVTNICTGSTSTTVDLTPIANLALNVELQGRSQADGDYIIELFETGTTNRVLNQSQTIASDDQLAIRDIPLGDYDILLKRNQYLSRKIAGATLVDQSNILDFTFENSAELRGGDVDDDDAVNIQDFSILASTFNVFPNEEGYDSRADFTGDGLVSILDFSILASNFNLAGDVPGLAPRSEPGDDAECRQQVSPIVLELIPQKKTVPLFRESYIDVVATSGAQVIDGYSFQLEYNPAILEVMGIEWSPEAEVVLLEQIDPTRGQIAMAAGSFAGYPSASLPLARIRVRTKASGTTPLRLTGYGNEGPLATCSGYPLAVEVQTQTIRVDGAASVPALDVQLFPNPASDRITIEWSNIPEEGPTQIRMLDMRGREVWKSAVVNANRTQINIQHLANGLYSLEVRNGRRAQRLRWGKQ